MVNFSKNLAGAYRYRKRTDGSRFHKKNQDVVARHFSISRRRTHIVHLKKCTVGYEVAIQ